MLVSIVIKSKDEAPRLRLVLASLRCQTIPIRRPGEYVDGRDHAAEVIVVDDGSTDGTAALIEAESAEWPLRCVRLEPNQGRSAAANAGAAAATGELLIFLDGDTLANPELAERHATAHAGAERRFFGRGEHYHLRCTRLFANPEAGTPRPGCEEQVARMGAELARNLVTREQVLDRFEEVRRRAQPGIYPGAAPRKLFELEWDALHNQPELSVLWMAAAGHNASVRRDDFERVGGFDPHLTINEHRELALRLQEAGVPVRPVVGARTYHLTHRTGWRDPLSDHEWQETFYARHPHVAVRLMPVFWQSISDPKFPECRRILSLPELAAAVERGVAGDDDLNVVAPTSSSTPTTPAQTSDF